MQNLHSTQKLFSHYPFHGIIISNRLGSTLIIQCKVSLTSAWFLDRFMWEEFLGFLLDKPKPSWDEYDSTKF